MSISVNEWPLEEEGKYKITAIAFVSTDKDDYLQFLNYKPIESTIEVYVMTTRKDFIRLLKSKLYIMKFGIIKQLAHIKSIDSLTNHCSVQNEKVFAEFSEESLSKVRSKIDAL